MSRRNYSLDVSARPKIIICEGESDYQFFAHLCARNGIDGFGIAFAGMHNPSTYDPSGFDVIYRYLESLYDQRGREELTDILIACDSADNQNSRIRSLRSQIRKANKSLKKIGAPDKFYNETPNINEISQTGTPRLHVLMLPMAANGGLETVCFNVARNHWDHDNGGGYTIEGWVDKFADSACDGWTTEKRDKLRLQAFMSAAWSKKPDMHFSQLFDITGDKMIPLNSQFFNDILDFLRQVEAL